MPAADFDSVTEVKDAGLLTELPAGQFERLQDSHHFLNARNRLQRGIPQLVLIANDADQSPVLPLADFEAEPHLLNAFSDVVELRLRAVGLEDDDHGNLGEVKENTPERPVRSGAK